MLDAISRSCLSYIIVLFVHMSWLMLLQSSIHNVTQTSTLFPFASRVYWTIALLPPSSDPSQINANPRLTINVKHYATHTAWASRQTTPLWSKAAEQAYRVCNRPALFNARDACGTAHEHAITQWRGWAPSGLEDICSTTIYLSCIYHDYMTSFRWIILCKEIVLGRTSSRSEDVYPLSMQA